MKSEIINNFNETMIVQNTLKFETSKKAWLMIACAWSFYLYEYILRVSPSVMTNHLMLDFGVTAGSLGVLTSMYYLAYVPLQIPCGLITDMVGARKVITFSALLCVIGSILFAISENLWGAQIGRFLMGAGSACAYISCNKISVEWFGPSKFAMIAGVTMMMGTFGGSFGGPPFALLVNSLSWREAMLIAATAGFIIVLAAWFIIRDYPKDSSNSYRALTKQELWIGLQIIAKNPQNWLVGLYGCIMYLPLSAFAELWGVPYLMEKYHVSNELASRACTMVLIGMGIGSGLSSWISDYFKSRVKVMTYAIVGTFTCFMSAIYIPSLPLELMFVVLFFGGLFSGGQILYFTVAKENSPNNVAATVVGFTNFFVMSSGLIFQPLLGKVLDMVWDGHTLANGTPLYTVRDYEVAMGIVCFLLFLGWVVIKFIKETYPTKNDE